MSAAAPRYEDDYAFIRRLVLERSAILLGENKNYLIEARLLPIAESEGLGSIGELARALRTGSNESLRRQVVEAMTTNETSFFRDVVPFDCLRRHVVPELSRRRRDVRALRFWCAACSSGQEPYSILLSLQASELVGWRLHVLATDLSSAMVARTREGMYSQLEVNRGLPARMLVEHFTRSGMRWQVKPELRAMVDARQLNLVEPWPSMGQMDVVFLRNVLIYFDVPTKQTILRRLKTVLAPDGFLFLGGAETTVGVDEDFERVAFPNASCFRLRSERGRPYPV